MAPSVRPIVVDNASQDATVSIARRFDTAQIIENPVNLGFAAAVNQGVFFAPDAQNILLLNPDARLLTPIDNLVSAAAKHGLSAGMLTSDDGAPQAGFTVRRFPTPAALTLELFGINRLWPNNPVNRKYRDLDRDLLKEGAVEQPAGAFLMFRREVWERLRGFDERFHPVWFEDVDFCRRAVNNGFQIQYVPTVKAAHTGGHSVGRIPSGCRATYWCDSLLKYAEKHFRPWKFRGICAAVVLSSLPRMVAGMISERSLGPVLTYLKIAGRAAAGLVSPSVAQANQ
jgi:N-acetylglucosaminyl-diphospho-decaprenol L-rhamnosyltransferase